MKDNYRFNNRRAILNYSFFMLIISSMFIFYGCQDDLDEVTPNDAKAESIAITLNERAFYFLPPIGADITYSGVFDPNVAPIVEICESSTCEPPYHATFSMNGATINGAKIDNIRVAVEKEHYIVNWDTKKTKAIAGKTYRIQVQLDNKILGSVDVIIIKNKNEVKNLKPGTAYAVTGSILPVKFRIEKPTTPEYPSDQLIAHDNVQVIDPTYHTLDLTKSLLDQGIYRFTSTGASLTIPVGTVIVGEQGQGFLRRVVGVTSERNVTTLQTVQASLDEVFASGTLTLSSDMENLSEMRIANSGFNHTISNYSIYKNGPLSLTLLSGNVSLDPKWTINAGFGPEGAVMAEVITKDASLHGNFVFEVSAEQLTEIVNGLSTLKSYYKDFIIRVPVILLGVPVVIPVVVRMNLDLNLQYGATVSAAIKRNVTFNSETVFSIGASYTNKQWQGIYDLNSNNTLTIGETTGNANASVNLALVPKVSFQLYGVVGPHASVGLLEQLDGNITFPSEHWDFQASAWLRSTVGVTGKIFDIQLPDYNKSWDSDKLIYRTPFKIERVSGDNQVGVKNQELPQSIKVRVLDSYGEPEKGVKVYFNPGINNGEVDPAFGYTDGSGYAETRWTLGSVTTEIQYLKVSVKTSDENDIASSPLDFAATATDGRSGITVAGGNGRGSAANQFDGPGLIDFDQLGNMYIAEAGNDRVQRWKPGEAFGETVVEGFNISGIHIDQDNNLYITDFTRSRVLKNGVIIAGGDDDIWGIENYNLTFPTEIYVDDAGNLYVIDNGHKRVMKWAPGASEGIKVAGCDFDCATVSSLTDAYDIYVDSEGNIFLTDPINDRITKWAPGASSGMTVAGGNGQGSAANQLYNPYKFFIDKQGNIYVADSNNHRVQLWTPGATAGITVAGGNGSGSAANQLSGPNDVYVDEEGYIYVVDSGNQRVQKWPPFQVL